MAPKSLTTVSLFLFYLALKMRGLLSLESKLVVRRLDISKVLGDVCRDYEMCGRLFPAITWY